MVAIADSLEFLPSDPSGTSSTMAVPAVPAWWVDRPRLKAKVATEGKRLTVVTGSARGRQDHTPRGLGPAEEPAEDELVVAARVRQRPGPLLGSLAEHAGRGGRSRIPRGRLL